MQALGDTLKAILSETAMPRVPPPGLPTTVGPTYPPPSSQTLDGLRELIRASLAGQPDTGARLEASLRRHFGQRLVIRSKTRPVYGQNGYDEVFLGISANVDCLTDEEIPFLQTLEKLNMPAKPEQIAGYVARMRMTLLRTAEENLDIEVLVDTMIDICRDYPADVIAAVSRKWIKAKRFFPVPSEFLAELDAATSLRRAVLRAFVAARKPLLAAPPAPAQENQGAEENLTPSQNRRAWERARAEVAARWPSARAAQEQPAQEEHGAAAA